MKKRTKFYNSPLVGFILSLFVNILFLFVLINLGDYLSISRKGFVIAVSAISVFALLVNLLFIWGFAYRKSTVRKVFVIISSLLILGFGFTVYFTNRLNKGIDALIDQDNEELLDYSFVTLEEGKTADNLFSENSIGYVEGDEIFNEAIKKEISNQSPTVEVKVYDRYEDMLHSLIEAETLDVAILPKHFNSYAEGMSEYAQDALREAHVIHNFNIKISTREQSAAKVLEEPFSVLMLGINENLADSIILTTINPNTLDVTMTSIARDSYVPISCYRNQSSDKINHSRKISRQCLIDTVEELLDTEVDFYFETDFYALVKIVDVLGGLEIESPISFGGSLPKEDNPNEYHEVYIQEGKHLMTGQQVITFARERHHFPTGDFQRQLNQQYVIKELVNKIFQESKRNVETPIKVLESAKDNIVMNLSMNRDISPLLGFAINNIAASPVSPMETFNIRSIQLHGDVSTVGNMSVIVPYRYSVEDVREIIKQTRSTEIKKPQETPFSFSLNYPYEYEIDAEAYNYYNTPLYNEVTQWEPEPAPTQEYEVPDFTTMSISEVKSWALNHGVEISVNRIDKDHPSFNDHYDDGQIIYQSREPGMYESLPSYIEVSEVSKPTEFDEVEEDPVDEMPENDVDSSEEETDDGPIDSNDE